MNTTTVLARTLRAGDEIEGFGRIQRLARFAGVTHIYDADDRHEVLPDEHKVNRVIIADDLVERIDALERRLGEIEQPQQKPEPPRQSAWSLVKLPLVVNRSIIQDAVGDEWFRGANADTTDAQDAEIASELVRRANAYETVVQLLHDSAGRHISYERAREILAALGETL